MSSAAASHKLFKQKHCVLCCCMLHCPRLSMLCCVVGLCAAYPVLGIPALPCAALTSAVLRCF